MAINKATPRPIQEGIKDSSAVAIPLEREASPQHLPIFPIQCQRGPLRTVFTTGTAMIKTFGAKTFQEAEKFFSHQTMALMETVGQGQMVGVRRIVDATAKSAGVCLAIEYVKDDNVVYQRNAVDGAYVLDVNGDPIPVAPARAISGIKKRMVLIDVNEANFRSLPTTNGTLTGTGGNSTIVPLVSFIDEVGARGNNLGFRLSQPHLKSNSPANDFVADDQETFLYRFQWYERPSIRESAALIQTLTLAREVDFSLRKGAINTKTNRSYEKDLLTSAYERKGTGIIPVPPPNKETYFYEANIEAVLKELFDAEEAALAAEGLVSPYGDKHEMNLIGDTSFAGSPFVGILEVTGGIKMDAETTHYLRNGSDGTVDEATLDTEVRAWLRGDWDNPEEPLNDWAQFPFSQLYDTGFTLDTKYAFLEAAGRRGDIKVDVCTQDLSTVDNTIADEVAIGQTLKNAALAIPESVIHGTQTCRISIWGGVGTWSNSAFGRRGPMLIDIVRKRAAYGGAGNGILKSTYSYDVRERNSVEAMFDPTHTYLSMGLKDKFWDLGINYVQYRDRSDLFWPAYQTVLTDDTSVLNSDILVGVLVNIKKQMNYHWSINTGDSRLTKSQFQERSDEDFGKLIEGKYDDRFAITYKTEFTPEDTLRGFSWTLNVDAASDPARTVGQYHLTVSRPD